MYLTNASFAFIMYAWVFGPFIVDYTEKEGSVMFQIVRKKELNSAVTLMDIHAPFIAKKAKAGQFIIDRKSVV